MNDDLLSAEALLLARSYLYELFHKTFGGAPSSQLIEQFISPETRDAFYEYAASGKKIAELCQFLKELSARLCDREELFAFRDSAQDEYTRLFVGPGPLPAQPMETPHVAHETVLFSENTVTVRRIYKAHGFTPVREFHIADDHVSLMCDFMARLSRELLDLFRMGDDSAMRLSAVEQKDFVMNHMVNWLPKVAKVHSEISDPIIYPLLTAAFAEFVDLDAIFLSEIVAWLAEGSPLLMPDERRPDSFVTFEKALAKVRAMRLFGLEDYELREDDVIDTDMDQSK